MNPQLTLQHGRMSWQVEESFRDVLLDERGLRLHEWLRGGQARVVKQAPHRTIYHVSLPQVDFYLKHYPMNDMRAWLRQLVRPSKARGEFQRALEVSARGVPTFVPLALGERRGLWGAGESFLLAHTLTGAQALDVFLEQALPRLPLARQTPLAHQLARDLGRLLARMHQAGIRHHDLHAGNLLVRHGEAGQVSLFLIDLHAVRLGGPLSWAERRANLAMFNRWFALRVGRSHRARFWRAYCQECPELHDDAAWLAVDLEEATLDSNLAFWKARDRRCRENNRYYRRLAQAQLSGHAVTDLDPALAQQLLADPDRFFGLPGAHILKDSRSSAVVEFAREENGQRRSYILKKFRLAKWASPWTALVRTNPVLRSWVAGQGMRERRLLTPRPLAVLQRTRHGLTGEGYLLTEKIEHAIDLFQLLPQLQTWAGERRQAFLRLSIDHLARLIRNMHARGLTHRDLKAANILVRHPTDLSRIQTWIIDLVGVQRSGHVSKPRRVQNLARLNASFTHSTLLTRSDRLRFLRVYLQWGYFGREAWKKWWRAIERTTQVKLASNRRRGRPIT